MSFNFSINLMFELKLQGKTKSQMNYFKGIGSLCYHAALKCYEMTVKILYRQWIVTNGHGAVTNGQGKNPLFFNTK